MKAKQIEKLWHQYMNKNAGNDAYIDPDATMIILYSGNDITIDRKGNRVKFPKFGWIDSANLTSLNPKLPEWVGLEMDSSTSKFSSVMFGYCTTIFDDESLPQCNGMVVSMPWTVYNKLKKIIDII